MNSSCDSPGQISEIQRKEKSLSKERRSFEHPRKGAAAPFESLLKNAMRSCGKDTLSNRVPTVACAGLSRRTSGVNVKEGCGGKARLGERYARVFVKRSVRCLLATSFSLRRQNAFEPFSFWQGTDKQKRGCRKKKIQSKKFLL